MDPAFPGLFGEWAESHLRNDRTAKRNLDRARVWTVSKAADGGLEERLDASFLARLDQAETVEEIAEAILASAAERDIAENRAW